MDLNNADYISRNPALHDAEQRKLAVKKAARMARDPYGHPTTKRRAGLVLARLQAAEAALKLGE